MFKQILGKLPRKSSKSSEHRESGNSVSSSQSSTNFRRGETGGIRSTNAPHTVSSGSSSSFIVRSSHANKQSLLDTFRQNGNLASSYKIEVLPLLRDTPDPESLVLFVKKLNQCCVLLDFTDPLKHQKEKEIKRQSLIELVDYVASSRGIQEHLMPEIIRMVSVNIFRTFVSRPSDNRAIEAFDVEEEEPSMDPAWPHLQLVYEILLKFLTNSEVDTKLSKRYIDQNFVLKLLDLFDSEDPRERELLKTILHRIYGKFMVHRPFIRKAINNLFYRFIFETGKHNGIAELLEILESIINGFTLPLKEEHKSFLVRVLIPLHKPKCVSLYQHQLSHCITQFVEKDCKLADTVIRGILKYWPITNSSKEVMFLGELEEVLEATQLPEFQRCMVPLFLRIAQCLHSSHFQVAERALFLWNNDHIEGLVKQNRKVILPIIFPALERNTRYHWNQPVKSLTQNVKKIFSNVDPVLYEQCLEKFEIEEATEKERNSERMAKWEKMEKIASSRTPYTADVLLPHFTGINISRS